MRLVRFGPPGAERPGLLIPDSEGTAAYDVSEIAGDYSPTFWQTGGPALLEGAASAVPVVDLGGVRLGPPIARPPKIVCIGLNYHDHAAESGMKPPAEPIVFMKAPNTVVGPNDDVVIPPNSQQTDWEVELGVVIGRVARYLPDPAAAREAIGGYVLSNDISEREYQLERGGQWDKGKSCETFNPLGPWLVTPDEIGDPQTLGLRLDVNGTRMQNGTTADMIFGVDHLVWYLSQFMVLEPGDLINTGTPAGVGLGRRPRAYLRPGDTMTLDGDGLGQQHHVCVPAEIPDRPAGVLVAAGEQPR